VIRRTFRIGLLLGLLGGIAFALTKLLGSHSPEVPAVATRPTEPWPRLDSDPSAGAPPIAGAVPDPLAPAKAWVEPSGDVCPTSHPVKAKLTSRIFHLPGMLNYDRTKPDRCYADADSAEADGLRAAKR
jgi:hypothetical protein